ncbi:MAG: SGNH/GDSL hydrolase family protein [Chitinophagaceae bacterium]|nr:MAG: SGNH/GDSL hydrolase family protein [Chitinophagaceae bacterium]
MIRNMTLITAILFSIVTIAGSAGCKKDAGSDGYVMTAISVDKTNIQLMPGETTQLKASASPAVANQPAFQWASANEAIATVSNGLVKATGPGETSITVSYKDIKTIIPVTVTSAPVDQNTAELYGKVLNNSSAIPELQLNEAGAYTAEGLNITTKDKLVRLDKFYALAERKVAYRIRFSADAKALFRSSQGDFNAYVDMAAKKISISTSPVTEKTVSFLQANRDYLVEVYHVYQEGRIKITDIQSNETAEVKAVHDGSGGVGQGSLQPGFAVGMQWDHYCFSLVSGTSMLVKSVNVYALKKKVRLVMYGDSITQPEGYFPTKDFPQAWTQQVISRLSGNAMSSGRGGAQIDMVLEYIKNELPFIETDYVMVTIGTNGNNTEAKLTELVNYIKSQGAIPVLNNIPSNESGTQVAEAVLIETVRQKTSVAGARFDLATSIAGDGKEVDKSTMYWEDYTGSYGWQVYHHPNEKGGKKMFDQVVADIPAIFQ